MTNSNDMNRYDANQRDFLGESLARRIFGAIYDALMVRKKDPGLTPTEFGERIGRDKTGVSKILRGPGNWTIKKISDVANALDLEVEVRFIDRRNTHRVFTPTGIQYTFEATQIYSSQFEVWSENLNQVPHHNEPYKDHIGAGMQSVLNYSQIPSTHPTISDLKAI
jgi:hypothetical protein